MLIKNTIINNLPLGPGVYKFSTKGNIIYIGKAKNLQNRVKSYFSKNSTRKVNKIITESDKIEWILTKNEHEALILEAKLISKHKPKYNVKLKENKYYPRIAIDIDSKYPRIFPYYGNNDKNLKIFGPYPNITSKYAIDVLTQVYPIRVCNDNVYKRATRANRACFLYDLGKCAAPCVSKINNEEYDKLVNKAILFLNNERNTEIRDLEDKMHSASNNEDYQLAKFYRNKIYLLNIFLKNNIDFSDLDVSTDAFSIRSIYGKSILGYAQYRDNALYASGHLLFDNGLGNKKIIFKEALKQFYLIFNSTSNPSEIILEDNFSLKNLDFIDNVKITVKPKGNNKFLLNLANRHLNEGLKSDNRIYTSASNNYIDAINDLKNLLDINTDISRIEVYDNSHKKGSAAIGGIVVFSNGEFKPEESRKIKLNVNNGDDYASMKEMAIRRFTKKRFGFTDFPDIILIDGGREQLNSFNNALKSINQKNIPILIAIAKENEELYSLGKKKPYRLMPNTSFYNFITMIRDKAHNNALSGHRKLISKKNQFEVLDFLNKRQRDSLLDKFGDINAIYQASKNDLEGIKFIGPKTIIKIYEHISKY